MTPEERKQAVELARRFSDCGDSVDVTLARAVLALAEDAARLDWLDEEAMVYFTANQSQIVMDIVGQPTSIREAIDAKRKGKGWQ